MIPSESKLSALELWARETAEALCPDTDGIARMKLVVGLIQARALECRHIGGEFAVNAGANQTLRALAIKMSDRSAKLEEFANEIAQRWLEDHEIKVVN